MAQDDPSQVYSFENAPLTFAANGSTSAELTSNPSTNPDDAYQTYFDNASWSYADSNNANQPATIPRDQPGFAAPSWDFDGLGQQHPHPVGAQSFVPTQAFPPYSSQIPSNPQPSFTNPSQAMTMQAPMHNSLTPAAQEQLRQIAMPPSLLYKSPKSASSPGSAIGRTKFHSSEPPEWEAGPSAVKSKKRRISPSTDDEDKEDEDGKPIKKNGHNMIEKRYRTNLNDKIAALRDSVPSLRIISKSARGEDTTGDREDLQGLTPAHKLNKATILGKATEYIRHLESRNNRMAEENQVMKRRIAAFEQLYANGAMEGSINPSQQHPPTPMLYGAEHQYTHLPVSASHGSMASPAGMIQRDNMKGTTLTAAGQPCPFPDFPGTPTINVRQQQIRQQRQEHPGRWGNVAPYAGRLMFGSLASLMLLEAVREQETSNDSPQGRGLFAFPLSLLKSAALSLDTDIAGYHFHSSMKLLLLLGTLAWVFVPSLFAAAPDKPLKPVAGTLEAAPSLAASIDVRRRAWLTAIQTVWVPKHDLVLEAAALLLKTVKLSLRNAIGIQAYQKLTGLTEEQETARVKAWSIALDSQLAGGDVEINKSRLILTLLASWTLPDTPLRSMLNALHIRVLLWDIDNLALGVTRAWAAKFARSRWLEARQLNRILVQTRKEPLAKHDDELPDHLAALVELDCDEVMTDEVIQRAYNLAYNLNTTHDIKAQVDGMDLVVEDDAIASPLDAVAAWWSTQRLHDVIIDTMSEEKSNAADRDGTLSELSKVTPPGSAAELRTSVAMAFWAVGNRSARMSACAGLLGSDHRASLMHSSVSSGEVRRSRWISDIGHVLRCAALIGCIESAQEGTPFSSNFPRWLGTIMTPLTTSKMSLLGCAAAFGVMECLYEHEDGAETFKHHLESLSGSLRLWVGSSSGAAHGMPSDVRHSTVERCLTITKSLVGMEHDTGYGSMSETEGA